MTETRDGAEREADHAAGLPVARRVVGLVVLPLGVGALWLLARLFVTLPGWALIFPVLAAAVPVFLFRNESRHFVRRSVLENATLPDSRVRRWFWQGSLVSGWLFVSSAVLAFVLLASLQGLEPLHWWILAADAAVLAFLAVIVGARLRRELTERTVGLFARRYLLLGLNIVLLGLAFFAVDYWLVGAADTRGLGLEEVVRAAYEDGYARAAAPVAGIAVGIFAALEAGAWHLAETTIPGLADGGLRTAAWLVFLLGAGVLFAIFTAVLLGVSAAGEAGAERPSPLSAAIIGSVALLGVAHVLAYFAAERAPAGPPAMIVEGFRRVDPCGEVGREEAVLTSELAGRAALARTEALAESERAVSAAVEAAHARAVAGTDAFLDWYFTVIGEYERLAAYLGGSLAEETASRLEHALFEDSGALRVLEERMAAADDAALRPMLVAADDFTRALRESLAASPCLAQRIALPDQSALATALDRTPFPEGLVAGPAAGAAVLAGGAAARMVGRTLGRSAVKSGLSLAGKTAGKRAGSILLTAGGAAAACAPGGPLAFVCGAGAAVVAWLTVDAAAVAIEEAAYREEMEREIREELDAWRDSLGVELMTAQAERIDGLASTMERFIPGNAP